VGVNQTLHFDQPQSGQTRHPQALLLPAQCALDSTGPRAFAVHPQGRGSDDRRGPRQRGEGVRENFGTAALVFDKFHVIQEANAGVEKVRRLEAQQDELKGRQLAKSQWIFRKNPEAHTQRELQRIEQMDLKHLMTVLAYQMRLILQDIYKHNSVRQARKDLKSWCQWVKDKAAQKGHELLEPMVGVAQMVQRHMKGILGHWKAGLTTAFLED
jgi:transposase